MLSWGDPNPSHHAYLCDLVDDSQLDTISRRFERIEKIAARYDGTNFKGEKEIAWSLLVKEAMRTLETIKKEMNHE